MCIAIKHVLIIIIIFLSFFFLEKIYKHSCLSDSSGSYMTSTNFTHSVCLYAELNELASRQSKITTAVRQREEMGTHL